jgi:hypothetical protein
MEWIGAPAGVSGRQKRVSPGMGRSMKRKPFRARLFETLGVRH